VDVKTLLATRQKEILEIAALFGIDTEAVWSVVVRDIPELKLNIQVIVKNI